MTTPNPRNQSGNVLFVILLGISLFVALSYAVTRTNRGSANMGMADASIAANEIMRTAQRMEEAVNTLMTNGTRAEDISFANAAVGGYTHTPDVDTNKVFHTSGGGVVYSAPETAWLNNSYASADAYGAWFFPADICLGTFGAINAAACAADNNGSGEDLMVMLPYLRREVCDAINRRAGIAACDNDVCETDDDMDAYAFTKFQGAFEDGIALTVASGEYNYKREGCIRAQSGTNPGAPVYHYYKVLVAR